MSKQKKTRIIVQRVFFTSLLNLLLACGGGGGTDSSNNLSSSPGNTNNGTTTATQLMLSGSVGDGPITGATITIRDANGTIVTTTVSDSNANYQVNVPDNGAFPYIISATSGIDMVTGGAPTFTMVSVVKRSSEPVANINPFSTLIAKTAQAMPGGLTSTNLDLANQNIIEQLNFGLDTTLVANPRSSTITTQNVAAIVKASETLAEMIRRTRTALQATGSTMSEDFIIGAIAADMTDGFLDGAGVSGAQPLVAAIANIVSGQVIIEALSNNLKVNGVWATDLLDNAIRVSLPGTVETTADVRVTEEVLLQAKAAIAAAQAIAPSTALTDVAAILETLFPETTPATIETVLSPDMSDNLNGATTFAVSATNSQLTSINTASNQKRKNTPPKVSLAANPATVAYNGTTTLSWTSTNAVSCSAIGGWTSTHATSGSVTVGPLTANTTYSINCINVNSQITSASVSVTVGSPPPVVTDPAPGGGTTPTEPTPPIGEKLAVTAVTASGYDVARGRVPEYAIDGDITTKWTTLSMPQWITLDLGAARNISQARMLLAVANSGAGFDFDISVSLDNINWTNVVDNNLLTVSPAWTESSFNAIDARYIRISLNSINAQDYANVFEIEVYRQSSNSDPAIPNTTLTLTWNPNPDTVLGYVVYYGPTADTATTQVSDISVNMPGFDPLNPSINYQSWNDLGLLPGDNICFTLKAYNIDGLSTQSSALCSAI